MSHVMSLHIATLREKSGRMDADRSLHEPLAMKQPTDAKLRAGPVNYMDAVSSFIVFCLINFFLAVILLFYNSVFMMPENILRERMWTMYGPTFNFLFGICVHIQSVCGSQALSIIGLCLILGLVVLKWTGRVTVVGISVSTMAMILPLGIPYLSATICELFLVMTSGPSKLRNEMLRILVYEFIGFYVLVTPVIFYVVCSFYKKNHDDGREVPWFFSAITFRILETINTFNFMSLMTKARYLPINAFMTYYAYHGIQNLLSEVH